MADEQKAINLVTSQISHGCFDAGKENAYTVNVGYAPSMIRVIFVDGESVGPMLMWYSTDPLNMVSFGALFTYEDSIITPTERGFVLDLSGEEYPPDTIIWETYGFDPQASEAPAEGQVYNMPADEEDEYGL